MRLNNEFAFYAYKDLADAHRQGWESGISGRYSPYKVVCNEYQKEFNRGHKAGTYFKTK